MVIVVIVVVVLLVLVLVLLLLLLLLVVLRLLAIVVCFNHALIYELCALPPTLTTVYFSLALPHMPPHPPTPG